MTQPPSAAGSRGDKPESWPETITDASGDAFVEATTPDDNIKLPKEVISHGTVDGVPWSLTAFWSEGEGSYTQSPGACAELFLGAGGEDGGTAICADVRPQGFPNAGPVRMAFLYSGAHPGFVAYFGLVPLEAERIRVKTSTSSVLQCDVLRTVQDLGSGYFAFFARPDTDGEVAIFDDTGAVTATKSFSRMPSAAPHETFGGECS